MFGVVRRGEGTEREVRESKARDGMDEDEGGEIAGRSALDMEEGVH